MKVALAAPMATSPMMAALNLREERKATTGFFQKDFTVTTRVADWR